jgi:SAM-dependent methyltransferase
MALDPKFIPKEIRTAASKQKSLRTSLILLLMRLRGNRYTTKAIVDLYFRLSTPITRLNLWRHRVFPKSYAKPVKINIGSGPQYLQGFINIEGMIPWKKDLWLDVRYGLPFKDESVDVIYSCHVFEHFDLDTLRKIFAECYRVLKPGGSVRFITPSLSKAIEAFNRRDLEWFANETGSNLKSLGGRFNDLMLCQNHHLWMPDFSFFEELLRGAGAWKKLCEGGPMQSDALTADELTLAEGSRQQFIGASLVVEGTKADNTSA